MDDSITILLRCLGNAPGENKLKLLTAVSPSEWNNILEFAKNHGVAPLLFQTLTSGNFLNLLAIPVQQQLREEFMQGIARNLKVFYELEQVLRKLHALEIPVIVLKGVHLAGKIYQHPALRLFNDVDIMVPFDHLQHVKNLLMAEGYRPPQDFAITEWSKHTQHLPPFSKPQALIIEVHWTICKPESPFTVDVAGLWQRSQPLNINNAAARCLSIEDLFLHLCIHTSFHHGFNIGLKAFCDIMEISNNFGHQINWDELLERARRWKVQHCVYLTLRLAQELLKVTVPEFFLKQLTPENFENAILQEARKRFFTRRTKSKLSSPYFIRLLEQPNYLNKVTLVFHRIFPARAELADKYALPGNSPLLYFCYLKRIIKMIGRHTATAWNLIRRDRATLSDADQEGKRLALKNWLAAA